MDIRVTNHSPLNIFIVDDDPDDQELLLEALELAGLTCSSSTFADGQELLDQLQDGELPDLILLDLNMPRVDGQTALDRIKSSARLRRIPVVVLTTSRSEADVDRCYELGANSFITKPRSFEDLLDLVETLGDYWTRVVRLPPH